MSGSSRVVIFGTSDFASLAHFYLKHDTEHEVIGFSVHERYLSAPTFEGQPVVAFEELEEHYSRDDVCLFAPMSPSRANQDREAVFDEATERGWRFISYVSSKATTFSDLQHGPNCFVLEDNTIQPYVRIGKNVVLWSGNHIGHHSSIGDHAFVSSHVVVSGHCTIGENVYLGVNSTLRDATTIGRGAVVGMGANVVRDVAAGTVNVGNPARPIEADPRNAT
ncbi:MAG: acetyltransferase [Acidimicrobiia bacterium]|nr:acetyltransferase [Acidimicrobiia bacterium]